MKTTVTQSPPSETIAVGMSGGIDSTLTAFLLKRDGHNVIGITMKVWGDSLSMGDAVRSGCYGPGETKDIEDARLAARTIGIPHHVVDLTKEYGNTVVEYFREEYLSGRTPNPCIVCNQRIKFGVLLANALSSGIPCDRFATGHYVRTDVSPATHRVLLKRGVDRRKDQSYFLYRLSQEQLAKTLFPLGEYSKLQVREMAAEFGFGNLVGKPESQDFFEGSDNRVLFPTGRVLPGDIVDRSGRIVGTHDGITNYTIGQRRGLHVGGLKEPLYVVGIDAAANQVIVGPREDLLSRILFAQDLNWIAIPALDATLRLQAKIRLGHREADCAVTPIGTDAVRVEFDEPQLSITPGQSIVFYDGDIVVGGGVISEAERTM